MARDFFTETLRYGAGQYFDVANVHFYPINPVEFPTMAAKVNEIRATMSHFGVRGKRVWVTETGMWVNLNGSVERQRDFIVQELVRGFSAGVDNLFWFDLRERPTDENTVHRWLISQDHQPINGYTTFQNLSRRLDGSYYKGISHAGTGIEAYQFAAPHRTITVLWSGDTVTHTATIPAARDGLLTDRDGTISHTVHLQGGALTFDVGPRAVFLEVSR